MSLRKAAEMALKVLEHSLGYSNEAQAKISEAKQTLRQALAQPVEAHYKPRYNPTINAFDTAPPSIEAVVLAEREACAKVCDLVAKEIDDTNGNATYCAAAIRARSEK